MVTWAKGDSGTDRLLLGCKADLQMIIGEGYLAGQARQIISYLAGHVPPNNFLIGGICSAK